MVQKGVNDSRELDEDFWNEFIELYSNEDIRELIEFSDDAISIPDLMDFLRNYSNIILCGGGQNECLKEVEIALMALGINYQKYNDFIYEKNNVNENIDPEEAYSDENALNTVLHGKRDVGLININQEDIKIVTDNHPDVKFIHITPIGSKTREEYINSLTPGWSIISATQFADTNYIVYRDNPNGRYHSSKLLKIMQDRQGFVPTDNKGETFKIGKHLGYKTDAVKQFIKNKNINEKDVPKTIEKKVGKVLFGDNPEIAKLQNEPVEKNTPIEQNIISTLSTWTINSTPQGEQKIISATKDLVTLQKHFPEILNPPYGKIAYRGTSLETIEINQWIIDNQNDITEIDGGFVRFNKQFQYNPHRIVSSWTTTFNKALSIFPPSVIVGPNFSPIISITSLFV